MTQISNHVSLREATRSETAIRKNIDNQPTPEIIQTMQATALNVFEPVREHFGVPIRINSFYRSVKLNQAIGGATSSQHCLGEAIDIDDILGGVTNAQIFQFIRSNVDFDQLIWEFGDDNNPDWVHVSYKGPGANRKNVLRAKRNPSTGKAMYVNF